MEGKIMPQSIEAEKALIASMISDKDALVKVVDKIDEKAFYLDEHICIVRAILKLYHQSKPVDLVTVSEALRDNQMMKKVGGEAYLDEIVERIPTTENVEYHLQIIEEKLILRSLIESSKKIIEESYEVRGSDYIENLIDQAESNIFKIAQNRIKSDFVPIKPELSKTLKNIENLYNNKGKLSGISSGFIDLDKLTGGFQRSDLIIIAARPSMGKTAFCLNIAENIGVKIGLGVAFFSLEMPKMQLCQRMIASYGRLDSHKLRTGHMGSKDFVKITSIVSQLSEANIFLDDTSSMGVMEIRAKARRLLSKEKVDIIIVDYLQLISIDYRGRWDNRQNEIAEISRSLKILARELEIPVVVISQLSRQVEMRGGDHRPKLSDLRDSGAIEQDADLVMFIYRASYYGSDDDENSGKAELILSKQRNGPTGTVDLIFNKEQARFDNYQDE